MLQHIGHDVHLLLFHLDSVNDHFVYPLRLDVGRLHDVISPVTDQIPPVKHTHDCN
jgi:hypothetical protein